MARYKHYDLNQMKMIPLSYADQIVEGSFEYALNEIVEEQLDLSAFEHRYRNDETGRSAYDPRVLLKVVIWLLPRNRLEPTHRRGLPTQRGVHGALGRLQAALHDHRKLRQQVGA